MQYWPTIEEYSKKAVRLNIPDSMSRNSNSIEQIAILIDNKEFPAW